MYKVYMSTEHAVCAIHCRHVYIEAPPFDANKIFCSLWPSHRFPLITGEFSTACVLDFPVWTTFATSLCHSEEVVVVQLPSSPHCSHSTTVH